ncbi:T-cell receptor alpha chain V region CTL-L17, partial [Heterocephalus glaber]
MKTLIGPLFLCLWLQLHCMSGGEQVEQHPSFLSVLEGDRAVISCTYTDSAFSNFYWYKQEPGTGLQLLIYIISNVDNRKDRRFIVFLNKKDKHLSLNITAACPGDSATYFCAAS